jgi:putative membrane protein
MSAQRIWLPYCGAAPVPAELLERWNLDPILLAALLGLALAYRLRIRTAEPWRRRCFAAAFLLLVLLFVSPLCALSSALFSARVVHHILIGLAVAPLLVAALPPRPGGSAGSLITCTAVQALIFWLWHSPPVYNWALSSDAAYWLMQLSLGISAFAFWAALRNVSTPAAIGALLVSMVQMGLLGALITFSGAPLYAPHFTTTSAWGLSPLEDQQLAGLIMWAPAAGLYLAATLALAGRWLQREARLSPAP